MRAYLTVLGMYQYDPTILDNLHTPAGLDNQLVKDYILARTANMEIVYNDPDFMRQYVGVWSGTMLSVWTKLLATTMYEYNPIHNYDRTETRTHNETISDSVEDSGSYKVNTDKTITDNETNGTTGHQTTVDGTTSSSEHKVSAYNESGYEPDSSDSVSTDKNTTVNGGSNGHRDATTTDDTDTTGSNTAKSDRIHHNDTEETITASGNIGVTSTQQMIEQEREVVQFNIYQTIADDFIREFCIMVY